VSELAAAADSGIPQWQRCTSSNMRELLVHFQ